MQLLRSLLLAFWRDESDYLGMCGAGSAMISGWALFTAKSECKPASPIYRYSWRPQRVRIAARTLRIEHKANKVTLETSRDSVSLLSLICILVFRDSYIQPCREISLLICSSSRCLIQCIETAWKVCAVILPALLTISQIHSWTCMTWRTTCVPLPQWFKVYVKSTML